MTDVLQYPSGSILYLDKFGKLFLADVLTQRITSVLIIERETFALMDDAIRLCDTDPTKTLHIMKGLKYDG